MRTRSGRVIKVKEKVRAPKKQSLAKKHAEKDVKKFKNLKIGVKRKKEVDPLMQEIEQRQVIAEALNAPLPEFDELTESQQARKKSKMSDHLTKVSPLKLDGNLSENWRKFKRNFDIFLVAGELNEKTDTIKINTLLNAIGEEAVEVFDSFNLTEVQKTQYAEVVKAFADFCEPKKNIVYERFMFNQRSQKEGESFDHFLMEIKRLVRTCEFGDKENEMLRDRIVMGINEQRLQTRLLETANLSYDTAVEKCRTNEATKEQTTTMNKSFSVNEIKNHAANTQHRNNSRNGNNNNSTRQHNNTRNSNNARAYNRNSTQNHTQNRHSNGNDKRNNNNNASNRRQNDSSNQVVNCKYCGYSHGIRQCPAYGKTCDKCNKPNHFKSCCRSRDVATINAMHNDYDFDDNAELIVASLNRVETVTTRKNYQVPTYPWIERIKMDKSSIAFKIDTGAEVDVLPLNVLQRIAPWIELQRTGVTLKAFSGEKIIPMGTCLLNCSFNGMFLKVKFVVVDLDVTPILGLRTCVRFDIVQPSHTHKHSGTRIFSNSNL